MLPDEIGSIREKTLELCTVEHQLLIFTGGTGLSPRDVTPDAITPLIERKIERVPYAMLSRGVAGFIGETLVLTFPGSKSGVEEYIDTIFPQVMHLFKVSKGQKHLNQ